MNQNNQLLLKLMIGIVILAGAGAAIMIIMANDAYSNGSELLGIAFSLLFYGITGSICLAVTRKKEYHFLGIAGIVVAVLAFFFATIVIVGDRESVGILKLAFCLMIASIALAHICFLFYITVQNRYASIARSLATLFISVFSLLIIIKVVEGEGMFWMLGPSETYIRLVTAALVLDLTATLLVPLCNRLRGTPPAEAAPIYEPPVITAEIQQP